MPKLEVIQRAKRRIVTMQEAALYAGVSRWTVRTWILQGKLAFVNYPGKFGDMRGKRIDLDDIDKLIDRSKERLD